MIQFRTYRREADFFAGDYILARDFFLRLSNPTVPFGWWDQQATRPSIKPEYLDRYGLWLDGDTLVAIACVDDEMGNNILCALEGYRYLLPEMVRYAREALRCDDSSLAIMIPDMEKDFQDAAAGEGFFPTQERDTESIIDIVGRDLSYTLPEGFRISSLAERFDMPGFQRLMRRSFRKDLEEREPTPKELAEAKRQFKRPFIDLDLQVVILAPDDSMAAFCGMWRTEESPMAVIEPVAVDPACQKMGLGKAAVYEGLRLCGERGSTSAVVLASLQFYFRIGFRPNATATWWKEK